MAFDTEVTRRKGTTTRTGERRQEKKDSSKQGRRNQRRDAHHNKQTGFILCTIGLVLFVSHLFLRHGKQRSFPVESERFERAILLRDSALKSGKSFLRKAQTKIENASRRHPNKHEYDLKKKFQGMRYLDPRQLPPLPGELTESYVHAKGEKRHHGFTGDGDDDWVEIAEELKSHNGPKVDYTKHRYSYPDLIYEPPKDGTYPPLEPMVKVFQTWEQDDLDSPPDTIVEVLQHFDYQHPKRVEVS